MADLFSILGYEYVMESRCNNLYFVDELSTTILGKFNLSGYMTKGEPIIHKCDGKEYSIQKYQGKHKNEYTVMEIENGVPNGMAQLFKNGIIQLAWKMVNGKRDGSLTMYNNGIVSKMTTWDSLDSISDENMDGYIREVVNDEKGGRVMIEKVIGSGLIVYRGEYNSINLTKEGWGIKYSKKTGIEKSYGYYHDDILVHIHQSFEQVEDEGGRESGERIMIEYEGDERNENAVEVLHRIPVYIGGYTFNDESGLFVRAGRGNVINQSSGICDRVSEWRENGEEVEEKRRSLYGGWYEDGENTQSIRINEDIKKHKRRKERREGERQEQGGRGWEEETKEERRNDGTFTICSGCSFQQMDEIEVFVVGAKSKMDCGQITSKLELHISKMPRLKQINIGNNSFHQVRGLILDHLPSLSSLQIGSDCFRISSEDTWESQRWDGICKIVDCPALHIIELGENSFFDFQKFEISQVKSLKSIDFGVQCFFFADFVIQGSKWDA